MPTNVVVIVLALALAFVALELWYFRGRRSYVSPGKPAKSATQEFRVTLQGGFDPDSVIVEVGRHVRLDVLRCEVDGATEQLAFDTLKVSKTLPEFTRAWVEFVPNEPGDHRFFCGTCEGYVVAQVGGEAARTNLGRGHQKHG